MAPVAFVVMPYGIRAIDSADPSAPAQVDFDALWTRAYLPALTELGYRPLRADGDVGAMILPDMIRRLVHADLVLADISLPNANVYYEVGVRHSSQRDGCVLVAASWAKPVFDLAQVRRLKIELADGEIGRPTAKEIRRTLVTDLPAARRITSPTFDAVTRYDATYDGSDVFQDVLAEVADFAGEVARVRAAGSPAERQRSAEELSHRYRTRPAVRDQEVLTILRLLRDVGAWDELLETFRSLPERLRLLPTVGEYAALAFDNIGDTPAALGQLTTLIDRAGPTSERLGMLGGRHKKLYDAAFRRDDPTAARRHLTDSITAYENAADCDLNDYYPTSNLPALYRERGRPGDDERAGETATVALVALRRARRRDASDAWLLPTSLRMAFHQGDAAEAAELLQLLVDSAPAGWMIQSLLRDLERDLRALADSDVGPALVDAIRRLRPSVIVTARAELPAALRRLSLVDHRRVLVSVGGAGEMEPHVMTSVGAVFRRIVELVGEFGGAIVDGGTDAGVMRAMGLARVTAGPTVPLIGVAARSTVVASTDELGADDERALLDHRHSQVVLVPGSRWGDEAPWLGAVADELAGDLPIVTVLTNGGDIAYQDAGASVAALRPVIVLAGTGRTADEIADARGGRSAPASAIMLAASDLVHVVDGADHEAVVALLRSLLT